MSPHKRRLAALGRMDWIFVTAVILLTAVGILFIYSASSRADERHFSGMTNRQIVWAAFGSICFLVAAAADYRKGVDASWWLYGGCLVLLVLVLLVGKKVYGAYRWLNLFGIQIQPAELAKLGTVLALAGVLSRPSTRMDDPRLLFQVLAIVAVPFALIMKQPDLGTAVTLIPVSFAMMFVAGVPLRYLLILVGLGCLAAVPGWFLLGGYQRERILVFFDPARDPLGSGWNKIQSEIAVGSGGLRGKGYLMGTQNVLGFLPRTVAPTDFIFSVIAEELGFAGSLALLVLYGTVIGCAMRSALRARDDLGRLLAVGVTTLLFVHVFVNMAMTVGILPITGIPLPLISYGGSFTVCTMAGLGLVQSVYARRPPR
jgi:rod shape determining protein RodA